MFPSFFPAECIVEQFPMSVWGTVLPRLLRTRPFWPPQNPFSLHSNFISHKIKDKLKKTRVILKNLMRLTILKGIWFRIHYILLYFTWFWLYFSTLLYILYFSLIIFLLLHSDLFYIFQWFQISYKINQWQQNDDFLEINVQSFVRIGSKIYKRLLLIMVLW